jgi:hypothetical protein
MSKFDTSNCDVIWQSIFDDRLSQTETRILIILKSRNGRHIFSSRKIAEFIGVSHNKAYRAIKRLLECEYLIESGGNYRLNTAQIGCSKSRTINTEIVEDCSKSRTEGVLNLEQKCSKSRTTITKRITKSNNSYITNSDDSASNEDSNTIYLKIDRNEYSTNVSMTVAEAKRLESYFAEKMDDDLIAARREMMRLAGELENHILNNPKKKPASNYLTLRNWFNRNLKREQEKKAQQYARKQTLA